MVLLLISIILSLACVEGLLQLFPGLLPIEIQNRLQDDPNNKGMSHPYIGYLHTPNNALVISRRDFHTVHHTDGYGFRNAWPWPEKTNIVVLGDSLTFGYGVEDDEAWPALLGQALPQLRVINLGLIGAGPEQYLRVYETFGRQLHPQVLVVGLFVGNDFWDTGLFHRWLKVESEENYLAWRDSGRSKADEFEVQFLFDTFRQILTKHSYLYNLLRYARDVYRNWQSSDLRILRFADGSQLQLRPGYLATRTLGAQPDHPEFQLVLQALACLQAVAKANGPMSSLSSNP